MTTTQITQPDGAALRFAMRSFATGVTIVTTAGSELSAGVTANAFSTVSLEPALVLVCLGESSSTLRAIAYNDVFAVSVLSGDQEALARRFASSDRARGGGAFAGVACHRAVTGAPIICGAAAWLDCALTELLVAGDHVIAVGRVLAVHGEPDRQPLLFHAGRYRAVCDRDVARPASEPSPPIPAKGGDTP